ncbi:hypothetical protein AM500_14075 [Bacillus sp. FJAT-18017]|nr:hypothetical protein AM500_14075 [Bacillus sp. FJAT-18017]
MKTYYANAFFEKLAVALEKVAHAYNQGLISTHLTKDNLKAIDEAFVSQNPAPEVNRMSYRNMLDPRSGLFHHANARRKHTKSQLNGETRMSQTEIILRSNAKAHRW